MAGYRDAEIHQRPRRVHRVPTPGAVAFYFVAVFPNVRVWHDNNAELLEVLLSHGADAGVEDENGMTAEVLALCEGNGAVAEVLHAVFD